MKIIKYCLNLFIILILFSCGEHTNKVKEKISLNGISIELTKENFENFNDLLSNVNSKNCNSNKLNNFFEGLNYSFDKDSFSIKFIDNDNYEKTIEFKKPNCSNSKMKNF